MLYQIRIFHCLEHEMGQIESVKSVFVVKIWLFYAIYRLWTTKFVLLFTFVHQIDEKYDGSMATNEQTHTHIAESSFWIDVLTEIPKIIRICAGLTIFKTEFKKNTLL